VPHDLRLLTMIPHSLLDNKCPLECKEYSAQGLLMVFLREGIETRTKGPGTSRREEPVHGVGGFEGGAGALVDGGEGRR